MTSPKAAEGFLQNIDNKEISYCGKVYVLGNRTKALFENTNFEVVFRSDANTAEEFINSFEGDEFAGKRFLFLKGDKSLRTIPKLLREIAIVEEITVYRTIEHTIDNVLKMKSQKNFQKMKLIGFVFSVRRELKVS